MRSRCCKSLTRLLAALLCAAMLLFAPVAGAEAAAMPYRIDVDLVNQVVTVLKNDGTDEIVLRCLCSSGGHDCTPTGAYVMPEKQRKSEREEWYRVKMFGSYAQYATRIFGQFMFHSLPYTRMNVNYPDEQAIKDFGEPVSHGCIRLRVDDAKFIAENCLPGTVVSIHKMNERDEGLREMLRQSSYNAACGQSYNAFFGVSDDPTALGNGASGDAVRDLQLRLKDLGIFDGDVTGQYGMDTVNAVREAQALLGAEQTGCATADFIEAVAGPDAPTAMNVTLSEGGSGPAVRALQRDLRALRLYGGDVDGVYDIDVAEAVRAFQAIYGIEDADGVASPTLQKAVRYEAVRVTAMFADGEDYVAETASRAVTLGKVDCRAGVKLRQEPSAKSEALMSLKDGETVVGVERGDEWSKVTARGREGYVMNQFMRFATREIPVMAYAASDGATRYTLGAADASVTPARRFVQFLEGGGDINDIGDLVTPATVRTGGQPLNLREGQDGDSAVIATIPDGTAVDALYRGGEWALVRYGEMKGYVMAKYLAF